LRWPRGVAASSPGAVLRRTAEPALLAVFARRSGRCAILAARIRPPNHARFERAACRSVPAKAGRERPPGASSRLVQQPARHAARSPTPPCRAREFCWISVYIPLPGGHIDELGYLGVVDCVARVAFADGQSTSGRGAFR